MKKQAKRFTQALEKYLRLRTKAVEWPKITTAVVLTVIGWSMTGGYYNSPTLTGKREDVISEAVKIGDYETAQEIYEQSRVLGAKIDNSLEERIYPKRMIRQEITRYERLLSQYPGQRDIFLNLADLYEKVGQAEMKDYYLEKARELDPNGERGREIN